MRGLRELCDRYDFYLIADEVITGFGRTGTWFGMEQFGTRVLPLMRCRNEVRRAA